MTQYRVPRRKRRQSSSVFRDLLLIAFVAAIGAALLVIDIQQIMTDMQSIMPRNPDPGQNSTIAPLPRDEAHVPDRNPHRANYDHNRMAEAVTSEPWPMPPSSYEQPPSASVEAPASSPSVHEPATTGTIEVRPPDAAPNTTCLPDGLRAVVDEMRARFGPVTIVSTTTLNSDNHFQGTERERLHFACKAIDFKVEARTDDVMRFLRTRPEVAGLNTYRNGLIHMDANERFSAASQQPDLR
jgi:hypothetical protein